MDKRSLSNISFDKNGHESALVENQLYYDNQNALNQLRLDILKLLCEVTCKCQSIRKKTPLMEDKHNSVSQYGFTANGSSTCNVKCDEESKDNSCTFTASELSVSFNSDSTLHLLYEYDDEPNRSHDMYIKKRNHSTTHTVHYPSKESEV